MKRVERYMRQLGRLSTEPRLKNKVCVITGASRGIGQAIAVRYVEEGAKVGLIDIESCQSTLSQISKIKGVNVERTALDVICDISNEAAVANMVDETVAKFGPHIHVLVNNAAKFVFKSVEIATPYDWDSCCAVNIRGSAMVTKHVLPHMKAAGGGSIVCLGSISSFSAQPNCATYAVTKAAVLQMAKNFAFDLAKYNIRVNALCPGAIETPISAVERKEQGWTFEEWQKQKVGDVMMQRVGHVREIANAALFFACDESSYCTGTDLMVDGGQRHCTIASKF
jgi:NAD(P)-dependent dehydrogenase (short-subunit alcohol dehydrogenase family)